MADWLVTTKYMYSDHTEKVLPSAIYINVPEEVRLTPADIVSFLKSAGRYAGFGPNDHLIKLGKGLPKGVRNSIEAKWPNGANVVIYDWMQPNRRDAGQDFDAKYHIEKHKSKEH